MRVTYSVVPAPWVRAIVRGFVTSALASMLKASGLPALSRIAPRSAGSGISVSSCRADAAFRSGAWNDWMTTSLRVAMPSTATSSTRPTRSRLLAVAAGLRRGGAGRRCAGTAIRARGRGGAVVIGALPRSPAPARGDAQPPRLSAGAWRRRSSGDPGGRGGRGGRARRGGGQARSDGGHRAGPTAGAVVRAAAVARRVATAVIGRPPRPERWCAPRRWPGAWRRRSSGGPRGRSGGARRGGGIGRGDGGHRAGPAAGAVVRAAAEGLGVG